jgi:hypothetical protein
MQTYNIKVTGTNLSPFDTLTACDVCDGGYIIDPMAAPLSFFYGLSSHGGLNNFTLSATFSVLTQELSPQSLFFKSDGRKVYVLGSISDRVYEYDLSTPWNLETATYASKFYSINSQETVPTGLFFKDNGSVMYLLGVNSDSIYQYDLTTPWDILSVSYASKNYSVAIEEDQPRGLFFKNDGSNAYVVGDNTKKIYQYSLLTPWDISTASYTTKYFSVSDQEISPNGLTFKNDGSKVYVVGLSGNVFEYNLTTPWDISTAYYDSHFFTSSSFDGNVSIRDIYFKNSGELLYLIKNDSIEISQYSLLYNWELPLSGMDLYFDYDLNGADFHITYNDLRNMVFKDSGNYIFCESDVIFDFSNFDQSVSRIIKIIFDPNNGDELQKITSHFYNGSITYPVLSSIKATYYPSDSFYTFYYPNFIINYEDGNSINLTIPLTSVQCGIFDSYKNRKIVESLTYNEKKSNILLFISDEVDNSLYIGDIYTRLPFILSANLPEKDTELPYLIKPVPVGSTIDSLDQVIIPIPKGRKNPVIPPTLLYIYSEYDGISITVNNTFFNPSDEFTLYCTTAPSTTIPNPTGLVTLSDSFKINTFDVNDLFPFGTVFPPIFPSSGCDNSLILTTGGAPYFAGTGVTINVVADLNN